jgi:catechol 2,3-dioxygenase-like lactoylglutathione lyase family enzyme
MMQRDKLFSSFSVADIDEAYSFYKDLLGLDVTKEEMSVLSITVNGEMRIVVYPKEDHVPATYTVLNIPVTDIDQAVDELSEKGIVFLQYDTDYIKTDSKGIARNTGGPVHAWFTDPAQNIISLLQE